jgi:hypothetical protein
MTAASSLARELPEPAVGACYRHGGRAFLAELPILLVLGLVTAGAVCASWALLGGRGPVALAGLAFSVLVAIPLKWGFFYVCLRAVRGEAPEGRDLLRAFERHREAAVAAAAVGLLTFLGVCLLVVPGIVLACRFAFVPYLLTDEGLDAQEALRESWRLTRGRSWTIFGIGAMGSLLSLVGLAAGGIGLLPAQMWWDLALASFYHAEIEPSRSTSLA